MTDLAAPSVDFSVLSDDDLQHMGGHILDVAKLSRMCDPFACWSEQEKPVTRKEVKECIAQGDASLVETPLWTTIFFGQTDITAEDNRRRHIQKIAWFVLNPATDAISLDVGCQSLGWIASHLVEDGNHRLAAAIIRKDKTIRAHVGGGVSDAKRLKLWNPNIYQEELDRRQDAPSPPRKPRHKP